MFSGVLSKTVIYVIFGRSLKHYLVNSGYVTCFRDDITGF